MISGEGTEAIAVYFYQGTALGIKY